MKIYITKHNETGIGLYILFLGILTIAVSILMIREQETLSSVVGGICLVSGIVFIVWSISLLSSKRTYEVEAEEIKRTQEDDLYV